MPVAAAIDRVDQCVSPAGGASSSVLAITRWTCSSPTVRGRPGRGSSDKPASRSDRNRRRHFDTMSRDTPSSAATCPIVPPSADRNTIRDRNANACAVFRRRAHPCNTCRSPSDRTTRSGFGLGTHRAYRVMSNFRLGTPASGAGHPCRIDRCINAMLSAFTGYAGNGVLARALSWRAPQSPVPSARNATVSSPNIAGGFRSGLSDVPYLSTVNLQ